MTRKKIACVIGTRPEVIKMAPVIHKLTNNALLEPFIICTAQHRDLADTMLALFKIKPDIDLNIMQHNQSLSVLTANLFTSLGQALDQIQIDAILAQGDTTTTFVAGMCAFYHKIPFGHIEAGLRSHNIYKPFPEEINRVLTSRIATWHFLPTSQEKVNLLNEGIPDKHIYVTGNTVIDALYTILKKSAPLPVKLKQESRMILMTLHRRESFGEPIENIFRAVVELIRKFDDIEIVYPVHPNPQVNKVAHEILGGIERVHLLEPQPYDVFVTLMNRSYFILSDSGGIQEEAPALQKPVLILRDVTERPLVVEEGLAILVGSDTQRIVDTASLLLTDENRYHAMQKSASPYGDGHAAQRIMTALEESFSKVAL